MRRYLLLGAGGYRKRVLKLVELVELDDIPIDINDIYSENFSVHVLDHLG